MPADRSMIILLKKTITTGIIDDKIQIIHEHKHNSNDKTVFVFGSVNKHTFQNSQEGFLTAAFEHIAMITRQLLNPHTQKFRAMHIT